MTSIKHYLHDIVFVDLMLLIMSGGMLGFLAIWWIYYRYANGILTVLLGILALLSLLFGINAKILISSMQLAFSIIIAIVMATIPVNGMFVPYYGILFIDLYYIIMSLVRYINNHAD